ncbi:hypothetical protein [Virgibacillus byunsanensis]|uniref:hypothetical protein n=1 Tax=Virgibacillus byunsanensis TaxID=570945 RepID=UPI0036F22D6F
MEINQALRRSLYLLCDKNNLFKINEGVVVMDGLGIIIVISIIYLPIVYNLQKRIRHLEDQVSKLKKRI